MRLPHSGILAALVLAVMVLAALPARAQLTLNVVDAGGEHVAPAVYDFGQVYANEVATVPFRLRNTSTTATAVTSLTAAGAGFSLAGPTLPVGLAPGAVLDFTVSFSASDLGTYSAGLRSTGASIILTATVAPRLTYSVDSGSGAVALSKLDFGSLIRGNTGVRRILIQNGTSLVLTIPAIAVQGSGFALIGVPPSGQTLGPQQVAAFSVAFAPISPGSYTGTLTIGDRTYPLVGLATDTPLPKPSVSIGLAQAASLQQGTLTIHFDSAAQTSGAGTAMLDFQGAPDPAIAFASGDRTTTFAVKPGDTQAVLQFQTGTTAGLLTFTVHLGSGSDTQNVRIAAAAPGITAGRGVRGTASLQVLVTGFDNTRTAGALTFMFYDAAGNTIAPGAILSNASTGFSSYFAGSNLGGVFLLNAEFPITGDVSQVSSCDVAIVNSTGTAKAPRIVF